MMLGAAERRLLQGGLKGLNSIAATAATQMQQSRGNLVPVSLPSPLPARPPPAACRRSALLVACAVRTLAPHLVPWDRW